MPIIAPWPADTHMLLTLSTGKGSLMISAWRRSRSVRMSSTNHCAFPPSLPVESRRLNARQRARFLRPHKGQRSAKGKTLLANGQSYFAMSALPPKADIGTQSRDVRFVPKADMSRFSFEYRVDD